MTLLPSTKLLCAKGLLGSVLLPPELEPSETSGNSVKAMQVGGSQGGPKPYSPRHTHGMGHTHRPGSCDRVCHQLSGGGPQASGSADRRDQEAAAGLKGGAAPCVRVWPFSRTNSVFLTNRGRERIFSARKGSLWSGRGRPGQTEVGSVTDREPRGSQEGAGRR